MGEMDKDVKELRDDLDLLKEDLSEIKHVLTKMGRHGLEDMRDESKSEIEELLDQLDNIRGRSRRYTRAVTDGVEDHPFTTILVAFGVGAMLGTITAATRR